VTDDSGAAVSGAKVTLKGVSLGLNAPQQPARGGDYEFAVLPPGTYSIQVECKGFSHKSRRHWLSR